MAVLHLMVGLPGSGKTTRAIALAEATGAVRLTPDDWQIRLFGTDMHHPDHDRRHDEVEALMWDIAATMLGQGSDVILDFGFWSRRERAKFVARAAAVGADCVLHYEAVAPEELERRIVARNGIVGAEHYQVPLDLLRHWATLFEPPTAEELAAR